MLTEILSSGIGYLLGKIWSSAEHSIDKYNLRKDRILEFEIYKKKQQYDQGVNEIETIKKEENKEQEYLENIELAEIKGKQKEKKNKTLEKISQTQEIRKLKSKDYQIKQNIINHEGRYSFLVISAGIFRILVSYFSTLYIYLLGIIAIFTSLKIAYLLKYVDILWFGVENNPEASQALIKIIQNYANFPLEIINNVFHACLTIVTFYFGTTHMSQKKLHR